MAMRLTGLMSGMDTESMIQQLVEAKSTKVVTAKKDQTKLGWKQDVWKELNTKLKNLQSKYVNEMRFTSGYTQKTIKVSNESAVSVITGENAVNGVQSLSVEQLAKTAYLTGGRVTALNSATSQDVTALTKMKDLMEFETGADGNEVAKTLTFTKKDGTSVDITLTSKTTISDVLTSLKEAGVNANFDANQKRFFISAKESGADGNFTITCDDNNALKALGFNIPAEGSGEEGATYIKGQNAKLTLNGAGFESNNNVFEINGLTFTALNETKGENVTITTQQDTDGIYGMIKNFLKEYNSIINEMDKLYNADSASGYEPLTDEEKKSMSESEIEKYESKIKDSLLRRDSTVYSISSDLKQIMSGGIEIDGQTYYLSSFGIETLSYFTAAENEQNAHHIAGDPDDSDTSGNADKLKGLIASDPDLVVNFFTRLSQNLYTSMNEHSTAVEGYRSFGSFYDDKKMKSDYSDYTTKIKDLEEKLADYEDKWYNKFAAMETAMAKMQNNASAVTSLLGGS